MANAHFGSTIDEPLQCPPMVIVTGRAQDIWLAR
jgi:hypothetical protein